jgi:ribosomal subunit interface protein
MEIIFHARGAVLAEDFRDIVSEKLKSLERFSIPVTGIKVEIKHEQNPHFGKSSHLVTLTSHGSGPFLRSEGQAFNDLAAFDVAVKSLELQLRKTHERAKDVGHESVKSIKP